MLRWLMVAAAPKVRLLVAEGVFTVDSIDA
jgi:hypothetical protein